MNSEKDRVLLRTKDVAIIIMIATVVGILGTQLKKIYRWDAMSDKVDVLETRVRATETSNAVVIAQLSEISKQLEQVNWQLRRMGNNGRNP